jgi:DNA-binding NtrC family response regulator
MSVREILIVDDDGVVREGLRRIAEGAGYKVECFARGQLAVERLQQKPFDLVISDLKMPGMSGLEVLRNIRELQPEVPVIIVTGYATVDTAVEAMKSGALDYLAKPFTPEQLLGKIELAMEQRAVLIDDIYLQKELRDRQGFDGFTGTSREMQKVYRRIMQVAATDSSVLITGESGTGKELVARAIHQNSLRHDQPFVAVDCTSLAENLLESELFGHVKGSFTGATQTKMGLFKVADTGTLFLDEVANISLTTQAKLLRVLQTREVTPIGGTRPVPIDIRLITATNRNLKEMLAEGSFREDLYFRLNIIPIDLPPLRERTGDLPLLIGHFLRKFAGETGKDIHGLASDAMKLLEGYPFPGNVRELENIIERAVVLAEGEIIQKEDMELQGSGDGQQRAAGQVPLNADALKEARRQIRDQAVKSIEKAFVLNALERNNWNITRAAEETGMLRPNFQAMLKKLGIMARDRLPG